LQSQIALGEKRYTWGISDSSVVYVGNIDNHYGPFDI